MILSITHLPRRTAQYQATILMEKSLSVHSTSQIITSPTASLPTLPNDSHDQKNTLKVFPLNDTIEMPSPKLMYTKINSSSLQESVPHPLIYQSTTVAIFLLICKTLSSKNPSAKSKLPKFSMRPICLSKSKDPNLLKLRFPYNNSETGMMMSLTTKVQTKNIQW